MTKVCLLCGSNYYSMGRQVYCSPKCRTRAYYFRYAHRGLTEDQVLRKKLYALRSRANRKKVPFDLKASDLIKLREQPCHYCLVLNGSEVDRKLPSAGYVVSNLVPSCRACNTVKSNILTYEEMLALSEITRLNPLGSR